ncbi:MAG: hypothetical protein JWQ25_28 [Daejeonella sp.]|nr:hypothetical protein [Daejeonella sp.]
MKKIKFRYWIKIAFIYLFVFNICLVSAALLLNDWWLSVAAILMSVLQFVLLENYRKRINTIFHYPIYEKARSAFSVIHPTITDVLFTQTSRHSLTSKELRVISNRSENSSQEVIEGSLLGQSDPGYEYLKGDGMPFISDLKDLRVIIGTEQCLEPYNCSILNADVTHLGDVNGKTLRAISEGANIRNFAVNTGHLGICSHIIRGGSDLVWQVSLADCTFVNHHDGAARETRFRLNAARNYVKMIELVLPAKDTLGKEEEILINKAVSMVKKLRSLSEGKPIGIKIINPDALIFRSICRAMLVTGINVDFITVECNATTLFHASDYSSDKSPQFEKAILNARNTIRRYGLPVKIIASGRFITEYDILKAIALGADLCFTAIPFALAIAFKPWYKRDNSLKQRIGAANFHRNTIAAAIKLMELNGFASLSDIRLDKFYRRENFLVQKTLEEIYFSESANKKSLFMNLN